MYEVSVPGNTSSGRTSSPSYGPIQVPSGIVCLAQTPYPAPGIPDTHRPTSFGNNSTAFGNLMALLCMLLLLFTVFVSLNDWWGLCNWHCSVRSWWHPLHPRGEKRGLIFAKFVFNLSIRCFFNYTIFIWLPFKWTGVFVKFVVLSYIQKPLLKFKRMQKGKPEPRFSGSGLSGGPLTKNARALGTRLYRRRNMNSVQLDFVDAISCP